MSDEACPVCAGEGDLPTGNYIEIDGVAREDRVECDACRGSGRASGPPSAGPLPEDDVEEG